MQSASVRGLQRETRVGARRQRVSTTVEIWILSVTACLQIGYANGEDFGQAFSHTESGSKGDETYIIISFSAFLAFCILSVITTIGYFSMLEDRLMKRYIDEGEVVDALVVSAEFARGGGTAGNWGTAKSRKMSTEYVLFVEYNKAIADGCYMTKIRKQVKAKEEDIIRPPCFASYEESVPLDSPLEVQKMLQMLHDDEHAFKSDGLGRIEMLVLPNFHKSGVSRPQVERSIDCRNRFSTLAIILSGVGLSAFCVRLAATAITNSGISDKAVDANEVTFYMSGIFAVLLFVEALLVHCCLKKTFVDALEEEYLKSGDLVPVDEDDSSLSTGSDFFLGRSRQDRIGVVIGQPEPPSPRPIPTIVNPPSACRIPATVNL